MKQTVQIYFPEGRKVMQQVMNILGRYFEHQREDRDRYIVINWEKIQKGKINYFWHNEAPNT